MNALSLNTGIATPFIVDGQVGEITTALDLRRAVFDDLMDKDLLGFLLSSSHLRKYLSQFSNYTEPQFSESVIRTIGNSMVADAFHQSLLAMFSGVYIAEATIKARSELLAVLDAKYQNFVQKLNLSGKDCEVSSQQIESVELAWRYRNACSSGSYLFLI